MYIEEFSGETTRPFTLSSPGFTESACCDEDELKLDFLTWAGGPDGFSNIGLGAFAPTP
jgi:hypothetical protein